MMRDASSRDYKKEVKPGDFKQALWDQHQNCVNSLNTLQTTSMMENGVSVMTSSIALEKFVANTDILEAMMWSRKLVDKYSVSHGFAEGQQKFASLEKILIEKVWIEKTEDMGMV